MTIIKDMPAEEYHKHSAVSNSQLSWLAITAKKFNYVREKAKLDEDIEEVSDAFRFGRGFHIYALEPDLFKTGCYVHRKFDVRKNKDKDERAAILKEHAGKVLLTEDEFKLIQGMTTAMKDDPACRVIMRGKGLIECSYFWDEEIIDAETGELVKIPHRARPDWAREDNIIPDLKKTRDALPRNFERHAVQYNYHTQAAITGTGHERVTGNKCEAFMFITVEDKEPHDLCVFRAKPEFLELGHKHWQARLQRYNWCMKNNNWPSYSDGIVDLGIPGWAQKELTGE